MSSDASKPKATPQSFAPTMAAPVGNSGSPPNETTAFNTSAFASQAEGNSSAAPDTLPENFGRYRVTKLLGRGGMGSVFLAQDTQLDRPVALKIPRLDTDKSGKLVTRFMREARAVALLNHPNICPVFDVGEIGGHHFLAMAYIKGKPLASFLETGSPQPERGIALTVYKIALALQEAHANGILHRDLKPANIMVDSRGEPIVMDFGLSHRINDEAQSRLTQEGTVVGTPAYMAPEQIDGRAPIGPATDVYALGVVLYELLTGQCPYQGSMVSVIGQVLHSQPQPIGELRADVSPALAEICERAMAKDVSQRYSTMKDFAAAIAGYLKGKTTVIATRQMATQKPAAEPNLDDWLTSAEAAAMQTASSTLLTLPQERKSTQNPLLWFAIAAGIGVCLLVSIMAFAFWRGNDGPQVALNSPEPQAERTSRQSPPTSSRDEAPLEKTTVTPPAAETKTATIDNSPLPLPEEEKPSPPAEPPTAATTIDEPAAVVVESAKPAPQSNPGQPAVTSSKEESPRNDDLDERMPPPESPGDRREPSGFGFPDDDDRGPPQRDAMKDKSIADKFKEFDRNHDGQLDPREAPMHIIRRADKKRDGQASLQEMETAYKLLGEQLFAPPTAAEMKQLPMRKPMRGRPGPPRR